MLASDVRYRFVIDTQSLRARRGRRSMPASGQPAAASLAATRWTFSGPASWCVTSEMNAAISSWSIEPSASGGRSVGGEVAHDFLDLVLGQRGGAQQRQQRDPVGPGDSLG